MSEHPPEMLMARRAAVGDWRDMMAGVPVIVCDALLALPVRALFGCGQDEGLASLRGEWVRRADNDGRLIMGSRSSTRARAAVGSGVSAVNGFGV